MKPSVALQTDVSTSSQSYRAILRSTSITGGSSIVVILCGIVSAKAAALFVGPTGVGLIGLLTSLAVLASSVAGLGFGTVGTRQIAEALGRNDAVEMRAVRRALFLGTSVLALVGATAFWCLRGVLAQRVLGDASLAAEVGWVAPTVALMIAVAAQSAVFAGSHRIGDLAVVAVVAALFSATFGVAALYAWGHGGLVIFIFAAPAASCVWGAVLLARRRDAKAPPAAWAGVVRHWKILAATGAAFMMAGLVGSSGQLIVRVMVNNQLGAEALGFFQAASAISVTYIALVLGAMGTSYFPRLTAAMADRAAAHRMVNEQTEVALLLAGPVLLFMVGLAPYVIQLLYEASFIPAAQILRWQVLGDVLKVCSWPLGFMLLAAGHSRTFLWLEIAALAVLLTLTWLLIPLVGQVAPGLAYVGMYLVYLPLAYSITGVKWLPAIWLQAGSLMMAVAGVLVVSAESSVAGAVVGVVASAMFALYGLKRLARQAELGGPATSAVLLARRIFLKSDGRDD